MELLAIIIQVSMFILLIWIAVKFWEIHRSLQEDSDDFNEVMAICAYTDHLLNKQFYRILTFVGLYLLLIIIMNV